MAKYISKLINGEELYYLKDSEARTNKADKSATVSTVSYDTTNKKITKTINGTTSDVVTAAKIVTDGGGITSHQNISGKVDKTTTVNGHALSSNVTVTKSDVGLGNVTNDAQVKRSEMGVASGVATLDSAGKVPSSQLPSYVDDVLEYDKKASFPATGETGKIYVDKATNLTWRWGGSAYVEISPSLALGETSSTAYAGNKGKALADKLEGIESGAQVHIAPTTAEVKAALGTGTGTTKYLREDGTWQTPPDHTYTVNNGTYSVKTLVGSTTTTVSDFTANQSGTDDITFVQGSNVTITPDATNRKITIAAKDTTYSNKAAASGGTDVSLVTTGEKATWNAKTSNTGTVTKVTAGTGLTGGDITSTGTIALATSGVTAGTYKCVTVDKYGRVTAGDNTDADSHWTTGINAGASGATSNSAVTNPYVTVKDNSTYRSQIQLKGGGATTVSSDANGVITITSTDNNTNTWKAANASQEGYVPKSTANKILRSDANGALYWGNDNNTTYTSKAAEANGTDVSLVTTGEKAIWNAKTSNTGTITGIKMNGASKGTSGVVDLGTVITSLNHTVTVQSGLKSDGTTTISGTSSSAGSPTVALGDSGVTAGTYKRVTVNAKGIVIGGDNSDSNTLNTTGTSNKTGTKMFLAAATEQSANPVTYSNSNCYIGTDNCLYSGGNKVLTSETYTGTVTGVKVGTTSYSPSSGIVTIPAYPTALPASDVSSWAKASSKPSYSYSEIGYGINAVSSSGGTVSLAGTTPLHLVTLAGNVSALTLSSNPAEGHSCHVIFTAAAKQTVAIAHDATNRVCPEAKDVSLTVPANGFVEIDFLTINGKVYVRGV